jgi:hypothetical protein
MPPRDTPADIPGFRHCQLLCSLRPCSLVGILRYLSAVPAEISRGPPSADACNPVTFPEKRAGQFRGLVRCGVTGFHVSFFLRKGMGGTGKGSQGRGETVRVVREKRKTGEGLGRVVRVGADCTGSYGQGRDGSGRMVRYIPGWSPRSSRRQNLQFRRQKYFPLDRSTSKYSRVHGRVCLQCEQVLRSSGRSGGGSRKPCRGPAQCGQGS